MKEIQVPGSAPAFNKPAPRWSQEMDEMDAVKELREQHSGSIEEVTDFLRNDQREGIRLVAHNIIQKLKADEVAD